MKKMLYSLRYYTLGREQYHECLEKARKNNLYGLRQGNVVAAVLASAFAFFPIVIDGNYRKPPFIL